MVRRSRIAKIVIMHSSTVVKSTHLKQFRLFGLLRILLFDLDFLCCSSLHSGFLRLNLCLLGFSLCQFLSLGSCNLLRLSIGLLDFIFGAFLFVLGSLLCLKCLGLDCLCF